MQASFDRNHAKEAIMGLMDVLNGMQNGPRGPKQEGGGGMSPLTMAMLGLLAYKAYQKMSASPTGAVPAGRNPDDMQARAPAGAGGGRGDLLQSGLGGLLGGGAAGTVLSGGLGGLLKQFEQAGQGDVAKSWVSTGANKAISPDDLQKALGSDVIGTLASHTEMSRNDLLSQLSQQLPTMIDRLTPQGRVPTEDEMSRLV